jgi:hypothetical protein
MRKAEEIFSHRSVTESTNYLVDIIVWKVPKSKNFQMELNQNFA